MSLTEEIVLRIIKNVGFDPADRKIGLSDPDLKLDKTIDFVYDDQEMTKCPVWSGKIKLSDQESLRGLVTIIPRSGPGNLTVGELILTLRVNKESLYCLYFTHEQSLLLISNHGSWVKTDILTQAKLLVAMETVVTHGYLWEPNQDFEDLYQAAASVLEYNGLVEPDAQADLDS